MNNDIKDNLYDLYASYNHHKALFNFWKKYKNIKNEDDIRERMEYLKKNKVKQRNELETLLWVLKEVDYEENQY